MKKIIALVLAVVLVFSLVACSSGNVATSSDSASSSPGSSATNVSPNTSSTGASGESTDDFTLAFVSGNDIYPFHVRLRNSIVQAGKDKGINVLIADAKSDVNNEVNFMESFITQGANAIATCPIDPVGSVAGVEKVRAAGIPYFSVCGIVQYDDAVYVGSNDLDAGLLQAEWLAEVLPQDATFLYLSMNPVENSTIKRREGLQKLFELRPDVKMLDDQCAYGKADDGMTVTETWLQSFSDFDAIVGQNDDMVLGAYQALVAAGKEKDIITLGVDGGLEALDSVKAGEMTATALQDAEGIGAMVVDLAIRTKNGEDPTAIEDMYLPFVMVTIDNVDEYIAKQR